MALVFEEAILPTLLFLPSVTPEREAIQLLPPAYKALEHLAQCLASDGPDHARRNLLDRVLRQGVLTGYAHSSQHVTILGIILQQTRKIVAGYLCIKAPQGLYA
jgi:hypothetical protein